MNKILLAIVTLLVSGTAQAEFFGLMNGGLSTQKEPKDLSIEAGFATGELSDIDYSYLGLRASYQFNNKFLVFGDIGSTEIGPSDELSFGVGVTYELGQIFDFGQSYALKGTLHQFEVASTNFSTSISGGGVSVDPFDGSLTVDPGVPVSSFSSSRATALSYAIELLLRGNPLDALEVKGVSPVWFASGGIRLFNDFNVDTMFSFGGGIAYSYDNLTYYAAANLIEDVVLGIGIKLDIGEF